MNSVHQSDHEDQNEVSKYMDKSEEDKEETKRSNAHVSKQDDGEVPNQ